jgi:AAA+ ATPase superfamily predicted ATPase
MNPYLNRTMLRSESGFYGREREIHNIYMRITQKPPQSCSVVGLRRIGKSSLLYHLSKKRGGFSNYLSPAQDNLHCVYYDLQPERSITVQRFFGKLQRKTIKTLGDDAASLCIESKDDCEEDAFEALVEWATEEDYSLVFFFDEFDSITQNQNFDEQFFGRLRHFANAYNVAFVTSSRESLGKLCHTETISGSPFFNIFTKMELQLMNEKEAMALVVEPARTQGVHFENREIALVFELAGYHPFYIQIACTHLFELKRKRQIVLSETDLDCVRQQFTVEAVDHFDYCLRHIDNDRERMALRAIAAPLSFDAAASGMVSEVETLKRKGLVIQLGDDFRTFSLGFQEFLRNLPVSPSVGCRQTTKDAGADDARLANDLEEGSYDSQVWDVIILIEKRFRFLLQQRFEDRWPGNWESQLEKRYPELYEAWLENKRRDAQAFRFYERAYTILDFAYFGELGRLIEDDWEFFRSLFEFNPGQGKRNKQALHQKIEDVSRVRNPLAHGRSVPKTELRRAHVACDDLDRQMDRSAIGLGFVDHPA